MQRLEAEWTKRSPIGDSHTSTTGQYVASETKREFLVFEPYDRLYKVQGCKMILSNSQYKIVQLNREHTPTQFSVPKGTEQKGEEPYGEY